MASTVRLSPVTLQTIAAQIGRVAPAMGVRLAAADVPELGETFQLWVLPAEAILTARVSLGMAAPNGRWHHQVYRRGKPELIGYSRVLGPRPSDWELTTIVESGAAEHIDAAIRVADEVVRGEDEVRLLLIPSFGIQCLWILTRPQVLIPADVPQAYRGSISPSHVYSEDEFFARLRTVPHIRGLADRQL